MTPLPRDQVQFQSGDVLGVYVENALDDASGVVLLNDIAARNDQGYDTEEVWYSAYPYLTPGDCNHAVGIGRHLNTFTNAAPVVSVSVGKYYMCIVCSMN